MATNAGDPKSRHLRRRLRSVRYRVASCGDILRKEIVMTQEEAEAEAVKLFGDDCFAEVDREAGLTRYYVGACPKTPGPYQAFMGFSWEEALGLARQSLESSGE